MAARAHKKHGSKKICPSIWMVCFLFAVITGFGISSIWVTKGSVSDFYNAGEVWTVSSNQIALTAFNLRHDADSGVFTVSDRQAQLLFTSNMKKRKWKYMDIALSGLSKEALPVKLQFCKKNGYPVGEQDIIWMEGANKIKLKTKGFSYIVAKIADQQGVSFAIDSLRISTKKDSVSHRKLLAGGLAFSALFLFLAFLLFPWICKIADSDVFYIPVMAVQYVYLQVGKRIPNKIKMLPYRYKRWMRIGLMAALFLALTVLNVYGIFLKYAMHGAVMLLVCMLLALLALLSADETLKIQNWKNPLAMSFFALWCMASVSELVARKKGPVYSFYGVIMIFLMGFLFFAWNQKGKKIRFWQEICRAVEITFFAAILFCLFCRPEAEGFRYNGGYINPNPFGLYLAMAGCVFLCELDQYIQEKQKSRIWFALSCVSIAALIFFLRKTQCTTGMLAFLLAAVLWLMNYLWRGFWRRYQKRFLCTLVLLAVLYIPVPAGLNWGINHLPYMFHTTVVFPDDQDYARIDKPSFFSGETVYAAQGAACTQSEPVYAAQGATLGQEEHSKNRFWDKLFRSNSLEALLTGRLNNFTSYLKDMNLFGHSQRPMVYGASTRYAHNGILAYAHMYGVYAVIPYILMHLYFIYYGMLYWKRRKGESAYAYLPLSVGLVFGLENMMDNVDIPFHWIVWFLFMFMLGSFFHFRDGEKRMERNIP